MANFSITLDLDKSTPSIPGNPVRVRIGDLESCTIEAEILSGGAAFDLTGYAVRFECVKKDRTMVRDAGASASGNVITYTLSDAVATVEGRIERAYFAILKGSTVLDTTQDFAIDVLGNAESGSTGISESWYSEIDGVLGECADATADAQNATLNANTATSAANVAANEVQALLGQVVTVNSGNIPRGHATGDPVVVDDGYPSVLVDDPRTGDKALTLHGNSHQVVTEGRNLWNATKAFSSGATATALDSGWRVVYSSGSYDYYAFLIGAASDLDGQELTLSATAAASGSNKPGIALVYATSSSNIVIAKRVFGTGRLEASMTVDASANEGKNVYALLYSSGSGETLTAGLYSDYTEIMLENGLTATEWEPYTGGAPSPSPDYPQPITMLGARNLLSYPYDQTTKTVNGITFTDNGDGTVTVNGTATAESYLYTTISQSFESGDYVISGCPSGGGYSTYEVHVALGSSVACRDHGSSAVLSLAEAVSNFNVAIVIRSGATVSNLTFKPMIRPAACEDDTWVPYGKVKVEARGKNLCPNPYEAGYTTTLAGVTFTVNADKSISAKGTATGNAPLYLAGTANDYVTMFNAGTYTISGCDGGSESTYRFNIVETKADGTLGYHLLDDGSLNATFGDDSTFRAFVVVYSGATVDITFYPQVESGSTATDYEPYAEPSTALIDMQGYEVRELPDGTHDELTVDGEGNVSLVRRVGTLVADGTETWSVSSTANQNGGVGFFTGLASFGSEVFAATSTKRSLCDRFPYSHYGLSTMPENSYKVSASTVNSELIYLVVDFAATVDELTAWLAENPTMFYFPLATPEVIDLGTIELPSLVSYGYNRIETDANLPCETEATYQRDINIALEKLTEALATAIADLA